MALQTLAELVQSLAPHGARAAIVAFGRNGADPLSYAELAHGIEHMSMGLMAAGVKKGDRVAMLAPNHPNWIVAALAAIRAGATVVPIDAQLPERPLKHVLADSEPSVICTVASQADRIREAKAPARTIILLDDPEGRQGSRFKGEPGAASPNIGPADHALLFYTSGTTGMPKGVPLTNQNLVHQLNVLTEIKLLRTADHLFLPLPLHHVYPFVMGMLLPLSLGARIILPAALTGPELTRAMREGKATVIVGVPRLYSALMDGIEREAATKGKLAAAILKGTLGVSAFTRRWTGLRIGKYLLSPVGRRIGPGVRLAASGGAALPPEVAYRLESLGWNVATGYGLSETSPLLTLNYPGHSRLSSAGKPIPGVQLRIDPVNREDDEDPAPNSSEGQVVARGPNVFAGYLNLPEKTSEAFTDDGWFRTGDLGSLDHLGYLRLSGRASTMIVTEGGKHVQPDDVEAVYQSSPAIREIGVLQKDGKLVAVIVPAHAGSAKAGSDKPAIAKAVEEQSRRLRPFERISEFAISTEPLPKTRMGKVQRHELAERFDRAKSGKGEKAHAGPISESQMSGEDRELLRNPAAAAVWEWLIQRSPHARLAPESSLRLDLNIDSMEWLNLTLEIGKRAGVELDEAAIGRIETVHDLLVEVSTATRGDGSQLEEALKNPRKVLSAEQRRWLKPLSATQAVIAGCLYFIVGALMKLFFRVQAVGVENLPPKGHFVITPNHASYLDPFAIASVLNHARLKKLCWAGWTGAAFRGPITRTASRLGRAVPIDPERAIISSLALAAAVLKRGDSLVWFPEGTRSPDGKLGEIRPGIGILLAHEPTLVVPVHIEGSFKAMPRTARLPRPHKIVITFGEPIESTALAKEGKGDEPNDRITSALADHLKRLAHKSRTKSTRQTRSAHRPRRVPPASA